MPPAASATGPGSPTPTRPALAHPPGPSSRAPGPASDGTEATGRAHSMKAVAPVAALPGLPASKAGPVPTEETLRVSQRSGIYLTGLGLLGPDEVQAIGFTQPGVSQVIGAGPNARSNVLRRPAAARVLTED